MKRAAFIFALLGAVVSAGPSLAQTTAGAQGTFASEFRTRRAALAAEDVEGRLAVAKWCQSQGRWAEMAEMAREVLEREPENRLGYQYLKLYDENVPLERDEKAEADLLAEMKKRFGRDFVIHNTRHFLVVYDTSKAFAVGRGASLEKAYDAFMYYFNMRKLRPAFLPKRLVVVLLQEREDYLKYAREADGAEIGWSSGYYSQRTNRAAFYDDSTGEPAEKVEQQLEVMRTKLKELSTEMRRAQQAGDRQTLQKLRAQREALSSAVSTITLRMDNAIGMINNVKTVHEAVHQLAFNTGVQKRLVDYPLWFSEGLACAFEVEDRYNNHGPAVLNWGRIRILKAAMKEDALIALKEMVAQGTPEAGEEKALSIWYAQGWALFHYMYKFHRPALEKYLLGFHERPELRRSTAEERTKQFTEAFGDVEAFEKKFLQYLKGLPSGPPK